MARPVRVVSGWTIGGGGRLREMFPLPPWLILIGQGITWCVRHFLVTLHVGLWMYLVTVLGGAVGTIWFLLILLVTGAGYVGYSGRRAGVPLRLTLTALSRRRSLRRRWALCARGAKLTAGSGESSALATLKRVRLTPSGGLKAIVDVGQVGRTVDELRSSAGAIASVVHAQRITVRAGEDLGLGSIELSWADQLLRELRLSDLPPPTKTRLPFGLTTDELPVSVALDSALLVTGVTRSGKSGIIWVLLAMIRVLFTTEEVRLWVIDPKGGMELRALKPFAYRYAKDISEIVAVLRECVTEMKERQDALGDEGLRKYKPSRDTPINIIIVDEFLALTLFMPTREKDQCERAVGLLVTQGAACGFVPWFGTQGAQVDALGRVRTFIPQRICLKVDSADSAVAALGDSARHEAPAHKISIGTPGIGYFALEGHEGFTRFRSAWVPDAETREIAAGRIPATLRLAQDRMTALDSQVTYVYKLYDGENRPLRYGITNNVAVRMAQYEATTTWFADVRYREIDPYPNRQMAHAVEVAAINLDQPKHNDQHNPSFMGRVRRAVNRGEHANV